MVSPAEPLTTIYASPHM